MQMPSGFASSATVTTFSHILTWFAMAILFLFIPACLGTLLKASMSASSFSRWSCGTQASSISMDAFSTFRRSLTLL